jgi:peptide subunit release factor 1 (eRF1)
MTSLSPSVCTLDGAPCDLTRDLLHGLALVKGAGTSVVTVYVKPGADVTDLQARMKAEAVTAANIKCRL